MNGYAFRSDAIALSSPSGRMSRRARKAAETRVAHQLFGPSGTLAPHIPTPTEERASRVIQLRSYVETLRTACRHQLSTGRQNKHTRALAAAQSELESLAVQS